MAASVSKVVIIGGGVMRSAAAAFLTARGASVVVLETDPTYARASSTLSASSIRQQFSTPICQEMSRFGFSFMRGMGDALAFDAKEIGLLERGYLNLADAGGAGRLESAVAAQNGAGVAVEGLSCAELKARFPWLAVDDLERGALGLREEGWFDGWGLLQGFRKRAVAAGAVFLKAEAEGILSIGDRAVGVASTLGRHDCEVVVNAAGHRAGDVARWSGFDAPIAPERRCVYVFACTGGPHDMPLLIDPTGLWVRPEGAMFITGGAPTPHEGREAPCFDLDGDQFEESLWPVLARRVPAFETLRPSGGWAGQYDMNVFDHNALIGWTEGLRGVLIIGGFSGHGMQHAAAAGRGVAELVLDGGFKSLDLSPLTPDRIRAGKPLQELNVI